jgi:hypothetical protein
LQFCFGHRKGLDSNIEVVARRVAEVFSEDVEACRVRPVVFPPIVGDREVGEMGVDGKLEIGVLPWLNALGWRLNPGGYPLVGDGTLDVEGVLQGVVTVLENSRAGATP